MRFEFHAMRKCSVQVDVLARERDRIAVELDLVAEGLVEVCCGDGSASIEETLLMPVSNARFRSA